MRGPLYCLLVNLSVGRGSKSSPTYHRLWSNGTFLTKYDIFVIVIFDSSFIFLNLGLKRCRSLWKLAVLDPKSRDMTSLKRHFFKWFSTAFAYILCEDAKLMLIKVSENSCRYLHLCLSHCESSLGGYAPSQSMADCESRPASPWYWSC